MDAAIINEKIIFDIRYWKETTTLQFKERIIKYIFEKYKKLVGNDFNNINEENKIINNKNEDNYIIPSIGQKIHNIGHTINKQKRCNLCGNKTPYTCKECCIYLHHGCFGEYHNNYVYNKK